MRLRHHRELRSGRPSLIDRAPQHLPIALGDLGTAHRRRSAGSRIVLWLHRRYVVLAALTGLTLALTGAALALGRPGVAVYRSGSTVHVGETVLSAVSIAQAGGAAPSAGSGGPQLFTGDATLVLRTTSDGAIHAAASATSGGMVTTGVCVMPAWAGGTLTESCNFRIGNRRLSAGDTLVMGGEPTWHRRYDDGGEVTISVPPNGAVVPVPFPIGR